MTEESLDIKVARLEEREERLSEKLARLDERQQAANEALKLAREYIEKKHGEMNEVRAQIGEERNLYPTMAYLQGKLDAIHGEFRHVFRFIYTVTGAIVVLNVLAGAAISIAVKVWWP